MNLHGSINELQNAIVQLYHKLEQRFRENKIISDLWGAMANDIAQQISCLNALPPSFWSHIRNELSAFSEIINSDFHAQIRDKSSAGSLKNCFEFSLHVEEPFMLKAYVPIIRCLRENKTNQSLEFYILVKAHLARITRATQAYSGDPIIIQRSNLLLQAFEKEVQEHQATINVKIAAPNPIPVPKKVKQEAKQPRTSAKRAIAKSASHPLGKRSLSPPGRAKPLADKVELRRIRAHR
jgi:hypothetical protein